MEALRRLGLLRPLVTTLAIATVCFGYQHWLSLGGARKLEPGEIAARAKGHYEVVLNFPPEAFHTTRMQAIGRLIEVKGASVFLMDVAAADIGELARNYWIADVKPWSGL
jgi:hypothetical protein